MKFNPINIEDERFLIHPLRSIDMMRMKDIEDDFLQILIDPENTKYIPEKRLLDKKGVSDRMFGIVLGYSNELSFGHFITDKRNNNVIGFINIISPERAEQIYIMKTYVWMIEYYLHKSYWGQGIMSGIINAICHKMNEQGINKIGAICDKNNIGSIKVLEKVGFLNKGKFDVKQDYYEY